LDFIREHFITAENVHKVSGLKWTDEVKEVCLQAFQLNLSLMFVDEKTGCAAAVIRTAVQDKHSYDDIDEIQTKSLKDALYFNKICDDKADYFGHYGTNKAFHIEALAVAENYRRKGLATNIFKATVEMICNLEYDPTYIKVEGSSKYSKKIFENAGFEILSEIMIDPRHFPDAQFQSLDEDISQKNYGKKYTKLS
jgi:ribosomal protein S18 acetylase RimI-like enzyme